MDAKLRKPPKNQIRNTPMKLFSVDAEVDGLYGRAFAIAVTIRDGGKEIATFEGRCPDKIVKDGWVRENVLPALAGMNVTHQTPDELEEAFWEFWQAHKAGVVVIAHCGNPVESGLFRRCVERDTAARAFEGPYPAIHDVATLLLDRGHDPSIVDEYNEANSVSVPFDGATHHPMYDAVAAAVCWEHLTA